jgi:hypothetical protein
MGAIVAAVIRSLLQDRDRRRLAEVGGFVIGASTFLLIGVLHPSSFTRPAIERSAQIAQAENRALQIKRYTAEQEKARHKWSLLSSDRRSCSTITIHDLSGYLSIQPTQSTQAVTLAENSLLSEDVVACAIPTLQSIREFVARNPSVFAKNGVAAICKS